MFEGYDSVTVGTFHMTSPMSSDPPPRLSRTGPGRSLPSRVLRPRLAAAHLLLHGARERLVGLAPLGIPTFWMFA
jgi:hypothetical protein